MGRVEDSTVVDVRSTPFDCGSCARILTALAAMQLWQVPPPPARTPAASALQHQTKHGDAHYHTELAGASPTQQA
jgi:hypothetical protein